MSFMHHGRPPTQPAAPAGRLLSGRDRTTALFLAILTVLLAAGFVLAPRALTGSGPTHGHSLSAAASHAFTAYWQSRRHSYPSALADLVAYWRRYHLVKAGFAVSLTIALCWLAHILWRSLLRAGRLRPATTTAAVVSGSTVTALAFGSVLVVMATIQGALAPFSSLVSLLPVGHGDPALTESAGQIQHDLAEHRALPRTPATLGAIIDDFQRYHAVLAVQAAILAVVLIGLSMLMWRRAPTAGRAVPRAKPLLRLLATAFALLTAIVLIVGAANISTALNPDPALQFVFADNGDSHDRPTHGIGTTSRTRVRSPHPAGARCPVCRSLSGVPARRPGGQIHNRPICASPPPNDYQRSGHSDSAIGILPGPPCCVDLAKCC